MKIKLNDSFLKQVRTLPKNIQKRTIEIIEKCKEAQTLAEIQNRKTLYSKKNRNYFRIRIGDYRIGIQVIEDELVFQYVGVRGDFYKAYPPK